MPSTRDSILNLVSRRQARRLAYWNGLLWAMGNGLCGTTLVIYVAMELNAPRLGLSIGLLLAARHFLGVLRLGTPAMIARLGDRKKFSILTFGLSALLLQGLPFLAVPHLLPSASATLWVLVILWCVHHLMQYLGMIAFYSWLADLVSRPIRGRFFGLRERWLVAGEALGAIVCGLFAESWRYLNPSALHWLGYCIPTAVGALYMLAAVVPLWRMPRVEKVESTAKPFSFAKLGKPFGDRAFVALLLFGCWFSFSNGLTQTVQYSYPNKVLQVGLFLLLAVQTGMRLGQIGVSPALGRAADILGNKPMMLVCLLVTAQGPLFYYFSTIESWWWFLGAWVAWIAYAGLNIGLPNLMLKIAPRAENADYLAIYFTCSGLVYGFSTLLSGWLFDHYKDQSWHFGGRTCDFNQTMFLVGWIARLLGVVFLCFVVEPPASVSRGEVEN